MVQTVFNLLLSLLFKAVYGLITNLYDLIIMLSDANIFNNSAFQSMRNNIFGLIGLFMVFKLAFSIIQYITDPDKLSDSKVGAGKILTKVVVVLVLLGTINTIFDKAFQLQSLILKNGIMEKIVFGTNSTAGNSTTTNNSKNNVEQEVNPELGDNFNTAEFLAYSILAPFIRFNVDEDIWGEGKTEADLEKCDEFLRPTDLKLTDVCLSPSPCMEAIKTEGKYKDIVESMCEGLNERNTYKAIKDVAMLKINKKAVIVVDAFGVLIGGICVVVLIVICVGIAIRSVKLAFMQLIAPLPIITYVDPKSSENGMFNKWLKETIKTFLELFIRLLSFYFAVMIITKVLLGIGTDGGLTSITGNFEYSFFKMPFVYIFLIIGCFLFALQLPKLIENLFGSLGGFSRDAKSTAAIAGGIAGITGGLIGGGIANAVGTAQNIRRDNNGRLGLGGVLRSGVAGITGAFGTGGRAVRETVSGSNISSGGLKIGKSFNPFDTARGIASPAIKRTGELRNASNVAYTTASGQVRRSRSASSILDRQYGRFAAMAGLRDETSPQGRIKSDIKEMERQVRNFEEQRSILAGQLNSAYSQLNEIKGERQSIEVSIDTDKFNDMNGRFDEALNDYVFNVNGQDIKLNDLSYAQYDTIFYQNSAHLSGDDLTNYNTKYKMDNVGDFRELKSRLESQLGRLSSLRTQEAQSLNDYNRLSAEHSRISAEINTRNDALTRRRRDVETIDRANKRNN